MRVILRLLTIFFDAIYDGISDANRAMKEYNEFWKGMRTMSLRQRVKELEADNAAHELAIASLRTSLEQLECEHKVTEFKPYGMFTNPNYREDCVDCGKVLRYGVTEKERIETDLESSLEIASVLQEQLDGMDGDE